MANLKLDLLNKLKNDKYYEELELVRLASEPNMNYKAKINEMSFTLKEIAMLNTQMGLVEQYFQDAPQEQPQAQQAPQGQPQAQQAPQQPKTHQGQTHGE